jgi:hypothetical protein
MTTMYGALELSVAAIKPAGPAPAGIAVADAVAKAATTTSSFRLT